MQFLAKHCFLLVGKYTFVSNIYIVFNFHFLLMKIVFITAIGDTAICNKQHIFMYKYA